MNVDGVADSSLLLSSNLLCASTEECNVNGLTSIEVNTEDKEIGFGFRITKPKTKNRTVISWSELGVKAKRTNMLPIFFEIEKSVEVVCFKALKTSDVAKGIIAYALSEG
jgi:hypothetical protein